MNSDKKQNLHERQKNIGIIHRNRQLLKADIFILLAGLVLSYLGYGGIGEPILWLGVIMFGYATVTTMMAKKQLK